MKKETLEEAIKYYAHNYFDMHETNNFKALEKGFKAGAKWQQERSYSYIEQKWNEYRNITNNEDAWSFKEWIIKELTIK